MGNVKSKEVAEVARLSLTSQETPAAVIRNPAQLDRNIQFFSPWKKAHPRDIGKKNAEKKGGIRNTAEKRAKHCCRSGTRDEC